MSNYYVYRYIDKITKEVVYIGKCGRTSLENRIKEHKDDMIGTWIKDNDYDIEFLELPREEDMNYLESYLIREYSPRCNIILKDKQKPPFSIQINESDWQNYNLYLQKKKELFHILNTQSEDKIKKNFEEIKKSNEIFERNLRELLKDLKEDDINFIQFLLKLSGEETNYAISVSTFAFLYNIGKFKRIEEIKKIRKRLLNYRFFSRIKGTVDTEDWVKIFDKIEFVNNDYIRFYFGQNYKYVTKILQET